jgi:outer membrane protein TolC
LTLLLGAAVPTELLPPAPVLAARPATPTSGGDRKVAIDNQGSVPTTFEAALPSDFAAVPAGLPSEVLLDRPDVQQAEQLLVAANANIGAARAAFWPRISLTGSAGLVSTQLGNLLEAGSLAWTVAGQALQTVFDNGRNNANLRVAEVNRDLAIAGYEKALQSAFREAADALAGLASLREQLTAQQRLREASARAAQLTELRARRGAASSFELLDAQRSLLAADQALVATRLAEAQNRVALFKAIGR